jgi:hypothetical protein
MHGLLALFLVTSVYADMDVPDVPDGVVVAAPEDLSLRANRPHGRAAIKRVRNPDASVELGKIFNQHETGAETASHNGKSVDLSITFDLNSDAYLSIKEASWGSPLFYKLEAGMGGAWRMGGDIWAVNLDVNIFRQRINNYIVLRDRATGDKFYRKRIRSVLVKAFMRGQQITVGGKSYRVFFSYDLDDSKSPATPRDKVYGIVLVHDSDPDGGHELENYVIPYADLKDGVVKIYELYDDQEVAMSLREDNLTLDFYAVSDPDGTS